MQQAPWDEEDCGLDHLGRARSISPPCLDQGEDPVRWVHWVLGLPPAP